MESNEAEQKLTEFNLSKCFPIIVMVFIHDISLCCFRKMSQNGVKQQNNGKKDQMRFSIKKNPFRKLSEFNF